MKKLRITVENKSYDVTVEVLEDTDNVIQSRPTTVHGTPLAEIQETAPVVSSASNLSNQPAGEGEVLAPMAGSVFKIQVKVNDQVKVQQPIIVLEAMKMETVIGSPKTGVVKSIDVQVGDSVQEGQLLIKIA